MTKHQRLTLIAAILGTGVAMLDSSIVNVALPSIERHLGGGLSAQQWIVNGYLLTLGSFILIGGSLGDVLGRRRMFVLGVAGFGVCSVACAVAPTIGLLIAFRTLQGVAAALLTPSSLAVIVEVFPSEGRGSAIGAWSAWSGISAIAGPLAGGWIVGAASWRWIFVINVPLAILTISLIRAAMPGASQQISRRIDWPGAALCVLGLSGVVFALIEQPHFGWGSPAIFGPLLAGALCLAAFARVEVMSRDPMVKLELFKQRNFSIGNLATLALYAALSILIFYLVLFLQQDAGYSPFDSGLATLPTTLVLFALSRRAGGLADKWGPRFFMACGPLLAACGVLYISQAKPPVDYWSALLPGLLLFALGLAMTVAPLTTAVLAGAPEADAGIASAINNAVARVAGLVGISVVSVLVAGELPGRVFGHNHGSTHAFHITMLLVAGLMIFSGIASAMGIVNPPRASATDASDTAISSDLRAGRTRSADRAPSPPVSST